MPERPQVDDAAVERGAQALLDNRENPEMFDAFPLQEVIDAARDLSKCVLQAAYPVLVAENERLREALQGVMVNIGVPGDGYPSNVAHAYDIAQAAVAATTAEQNVQQAQMLTYHDRWCTRCQNDDHYTLDHETVVGPTTTAEPRADEAERNEQ